MSKVSGYGIRTKTPLYTLMHTHNKYYIYIILICLYINIICINIYNIYCVCALKYIAIAKYI